jgi:hypothetical protein
MPERACARKTPVLRSAAANSARDQSSRLKECRLGTGALLTIRSAGSLGIKARNRSVARVARDPDRSSHRSAVWKERVSASASARIAGSAETASGRPMDPRTFCTRRSKAALRLRHHRDLRSSPSEHRELRVKPPRRMSVSFDPMSRRHPLRQRRPFELGSHTRIA